MPARLLAAGRVRLRVLTRDTNSPKAKLLALRGVELARGDLDDAGSLKAALSGVSAAFSVQGFMDESGVEAEERRGKAFADAVAAEGGGPHLVYSSADGVERNSGLPHYKSKRRVEDHMRRLGLRTTILRPVAFMEVFAANALVRGMALGMFKTALGRSKSVQLVALADVGWFAARALEQPDLYSEREIAIAGDELAVPEILATYEAVVGRRPWVAPIPDFLMGRMPAKTAAMFRWMGEQGSKADDLELRGEHPSMMSFAAWLKKRQGKEWSAYLQDLPIA